MRKHLTYLILMAFVAVVAAHPAYAQMVPPQAPTPEEMARLQASVASTLSKVRSAQATLDNVVRQLEAAQGRFDKAQKELEALQGPLAASQARQKELEEALDRAQKQINSRAASSYRTETLTMFNVVLEARSFRQFLIRLGLLRSVISSDSRAVSHTRDLKTQAVQVRMKIEDQKAAQERLVASVASERQEIGRKQESVNQSLMVVGREYESVKSELEKSKSGFSFPVKAPYSYVDTYGAPRMEGTQFYHRHEGVDIFALSGTPVLATVDGVLEAVGNARLGGIKLWLRSPGDNWTYYYAHLSGYAPGVGNGVAVKKGQTIGYVGNTGNAARTPAHLHFEIHTPASFPDWGPPTNPAPILKRIDPIAKK